MNYIYDITLNFNKSNLYEFYEWCEDDCPEFVLKIPAFKVDNETFKFLKNDSIILCKEILEKLYDKTEIYSPSSIKLIKYSALFICEYDAVAIEFDENGKTFMKSNLSLDEENDVLEISKDFKYTILSYKLLEKNKQKNTFFTRRERKTEEFMEKEINEMYENNEFSKLKYLFFEVFNQKIDDELKIYHKLISVIKNNGNKFEKLNEILSVMNKSKIMNQNS